MKIYVITKGNYSDYRIVAVATDEKKADKLAKFYSEKYETAGVEEYDTEDVPDLTEGKTVYQLSFNKGGFPDRIIECSPDCWDARPFAIPRDPGRVGLYVLAKNPEDAIKIGAEKRAQFLAEQMGL